MRGAIPPILFHFATPLMSRLKLWNELRTNRARIGNSFSLLLRSPQHLAWNPSGGTRSSLGASHKRRFLVEFLKAADNPESNQKWVRVNRIHGLHTPLVMPGLVPGIHVLAPASKKGVDRRVKPGHDEETDHTALLRLRHLPRRPLCSLPPCGGGSGWG